MRSGNFDTASVVGSRDPVPINEVRAAVEAWDGCELVARGPEWESDTVSAIYSPEGVDARDVISTAYNKYQTSLGTGLNKLAGKAFRIGGATDLVGRVGPSGRVRIQRRGRWDSVVAEVYQRELLEDQIALASTADAEVGPTLEELGAGFVQAGR